jgi:hypothetical protein
MDWMIEDENYEQLKFEGKEFTRTLSGTGAFLKVWQKEMAAEMKRHSVLLFEDLGRFRPVQLDLFEPAPRCDALLDTGDGCLICHLDLNHGGLHFDANYHVDWFQR